MSNSDASVNLTARWAMTELALVDSGHRVVRKAVGHLTGTVAPGLYELRTIAGHQRHKRVVNLRAGESYVDDDVVVPFTPVAPVTDADTQLAGCVTWLSRAVTTTSPGASAIVVFLRGTPGQDLDAGYVELLGGGSAGVADPAQGWAGWSLRVSPGEQVLRYHVDATRYVDVPVWAQEDWQTVVFVPCPNGRPDPADAVTHLRPLELPWAPNVAVDTSLELLLQGLGARGAVPVGMEPSGDPMLTLAHAATMAVHGRGAAEDGFAELRAELTRQLPGHPDVAAVRLADRTCPVQPLSSPPTLAPLLWRVVLPADHEGLDVVTPGSALDEVIPVAVPNGPWLAWRQRERSAEAAHQRVTVYLESVGVATGEADPGHVARAVGLPTERVRGVLRDSRTRDALRDLDQFMPTLAYAKKDDTELARLVAWLRADAKARLYPVILSGPDDVGRLVELSDRTTGFLKEFVGSQYVRQGETGQIRGLVSYEVMSLASRLAPAFGVEKRSRRQRTVVARGDFELEAFEDSGHNVQLAVRSGRRVEPETFALVSVRFVGEEKDTPEELAVPLTWMTGQGVASGALRLGPVGRGLAVFVVPDLVDLRTVGVDVLRRSLRRFANAATRQALARAVALAEQELGG